ncbi:MAG: hypothetical protein ACYSVY_23625 [Planctomycetota bacterium]
MLRKDPCRPALRFTPTAWLKLQCLCHAGETEIGGFGLVPDAAELLVTEFITVKQRCTAVSVQFDDQAVADYFDQMVDRGLKPEQFARCWLHTHPGDSAQPSGLDDETFERVFGRCDWAIMFVLARGGATYARLRFTAGPGGEILLPADVRWDLPLDEVNQEQWRAEHRANVVAESLLVDTRSCERGHRLDVLSEPGVDHVADQAGGGIAGFDFGFEEMEADDGFLY